MRVEAIGLARSSSPENRHAAVNAIDKYLQDQILGVWLACGARGSPRHDGLSAPQQRK